MKIILLTLIALPMLASAQNLTRSGKINIAGIGLVTVEAQITEEINGSSINRSIYTSAESDYGSSNYGKVICGNKLSAVKKNAVQFKITADDGKILMQTRQAAEIEKISESIVNEFYMCYDTTRKSDIVTTRISSATGNFVFPSANGKKITIALSANLSGLMKYYSNQRYSVSVNDETLKQLTIYVNNQSYRVQMTDSTELLQVDENVMCIYHPYDCQN